MFAPPALANRCEMLIAGDCILAGTAAYVVMLMAGRLIPRQAQQSSMAFVLGLCALLFIVTMYFEDLYSIEQPRTNLRLLACLWSGAVKLLITLILLMLLKVNSLPDLEVDAAYVVIATILLILWRVAINSSIPERPKQFLILGHERFSRTLAAEIRQRSHLGYHFLGFLTTDTCSAMAVNGELPALGNSQSERSFRRFAAIVVDRQTDAILPIESLLKLRFHGIQVTDCESLYERLTGKLPVSELRRDWLVLSQGFSRSRWRLTIKRAVDVVAAACILALTSPLAAITALAIKLDTSGPVLFSQNRLGLDGTRFRVWKFRSMGNDAEGKTGPVWAADNDPRITRVGRIIRRLRIDELPQLLNVVQGTMSLVGPRPERPEITARLSRLIPLYDYRHCMKPGLTGWAQVCYSYGATEDDAKEKLCYDLYYVKNWSLLFDLQIILQTVKVVLYGRGAR
jgi:sugar transferase (PEP-CTERM system associated)